LALLLDTQILVWASSGDPRLPASARSAMARPDEALLVSAVVAWEFADLEQRGRFPVGVNLPDLIESFQMEIVDFPAGVSALAASLPDVHRDPVDRMLVAHAILGGHTLVTADANIRRYPVKTLW
jgi:PIN domain nuclease of toxin-antitoxin system